MPQRSELENNLTSISAFLKAVNPYLNLIKDRGLRKRVKETLIASATKYPVAGGDPVKYYESPAAKFHHHNYPGGLLQHTLSTTRIALELSRVIRSVYRIKVKTDIVLCGVLLHDAFKPSTYVKREDGSYADSRLGFMLDHQYLIASEMLSRGFTLEQIHAVASAHGDYGIVKPRTVEALIVFLADFSDSRFNGELLKAAYAIAKEVTGRQPPMLDALQAFRIIDSMKKGGAEAVRDLLSL
jgi:7,8-dihydroneopterin 2',3'-cyclic phosphate phosphodiesterase